MTGSARPQPIVATADHSAALVRQLWTRADRVDAVVVDANQLHAIIAELDPATRPRLVNVLSAHPLLVADWTGWHCTVLPKMHTSEFILFYAGRSSFPESALIFTAGLGSDGWVTFHQRPVVLYRLRERFVALHAEEHSPRFLNASAVREQPGHSGKTRASDLPSRTEMVSPKRLYRLTLAAHFAEVGQANARGRPSKTPILAAHQLRACERARHILERLGGVIIADAVGLGKTYIGMRLLEETLQAGGDCLVIVPAALRDQWDRELRHLDGYSSATAATRAPRTSPADDNLDLWVRDVGHGAISLLSLESLGSRNFDSNALRGADLVLVDEAHNFRNPTTRRYRILAEIVRYSKVVLLTATPINNSILDLQHLIDLFAAPSAFRYLGVSDYREAFRRAAAGEGDVKSIISACVLRRTRRFLRTRYGDIHLQEHGSGKSVELRFPKRVPPVAIDYDLSGTYGHAFAHIGEWLDALHFPAVDASRNDCDSPFTHASTSELIKIILLKRLESSTEAFRRTVIQQLAWCDTALSALDAGRILTRPDYRASFLGAPDDPGSQLAFFELVLPKPSIDTAGSEEFRRLLESDKGILERMHAELRAIGSAQDHKLEKLIQLLEGRLAGRKVLIFTEFKDTAAYIYQQLKHKPHVAQIDSACARLGLDRVRRSEVIQRFAPRSNGLPEPPMLERVDLLIATDVLSEGLNLQDASVVVSYDLPWNPVRLMQRVGRIDRLGSQSDLIELYHFVPSEALDQLLGLMSRLASKVTTIDTALGLDHPVLASPAGREQSVGHIRKLANDRDGYERLEADVEGPLDPEEQAYIDFTSIANRKSLQRTPRPAVSTVTVDSAQSPKAVAYWQVNTGQSNRALWLKCDLETGCVVEDQVAVLEAFRSALNRPTRKSSKRQMASARRALARHVGTVVARLEAARLAGDALRPSLPQCRIAAWLSRNLRATSHRLPIEEKESIDRLLSRLGFRFTAAHERTLSEFAERLPDNLDRTWLSDLDRTLRSFEREPLHRTVAREVATLLLLPTTSGPAARQRR